MIPTASIEADNYKGPSGIDSVTVSNSGADYLDALFHQGQTSSITTAASALDLTADSVAGANVQRFLGGGFFVTFQPRGSDVFIRLRPNNTTPATTSGNGSNGLKLLDGQIYHFFVSTNERFADVIATANCSLFWWRSSRRTEKRGT